MRIRIWVGNGKCKSTRIQIPLKSPFLSVCIDQRNIFFRQFLSKRVNFVLSDYDQEPGYFKARIRNPGFERKDAWLDGLMDGRREREKGHI